MGMDCRFGNLRESTIREGVSFVEKRRGRGRRRRMDSHFLLSRAREVGGRLWDVDLRATKKQKMAVSASQSSVISKLFFQPYVD